MSYKILIIDDEASQFKKYKDVLQPYKELQLVHVNNGPDAIIEIQKNPQDLVFLDQVFNAGNVEIKKLYGVAINGKIGEHEEETNPEDIKNDELKQGLYILKMIRNLEINTERKIPIIFATQYVDTTGTAWLEAKNNGAQNYVSKDRITRENLLPLIERYLSIELITLDEAINNLLDIYIKGNPKDEKETFVKYLSSEASKHRRRGIPFIEAILKKLPQSAPTLSDLSEAINEIEKDEWKSEPVNPQEILQWALAKVSYDELPKDEKAWNYVGHNALRYTFKTSKDGKHYLLKIVHPKYSKEAVSFNNEHKYQGIFPVLFCSSLKMERDDPDWEGTDVVVYLEEMEDAKMLREYYEDADTIGSLEAGKIQNVLMRLADILEEIPEGHGMVDLDSIYIINNNYVRVADLPLWNSVDEKGYHMIEGLTLVDRRKRDIQTLGVVGDFLISGTPSGIYSSDIPNLFLQFVVDCKNGTWDINNGKIPEPLFNTRFFSNGQFVNISTERNFAYFLKKNLLEKNIKALVYLNTNVLLQKPIANEVDALVVRPGEIFWLDIKGNNFVTDKVYRSEQATKIKQKTDLLKDLIGKMYLNPNRIIAYCVLEDPLFESVSDLSVAERAVTRSYMGVINEINNAKENVYNLDVFITKFRNAIYSKYQSPYEKMHSFTEHYGNVVVEKNGGLFTELYSTEKPYYIRRYSLNCVSDNILDSDYYVSLIEQSKQERNLITLLSSEYILFPQQILLIDSQNEMTTPSVEKTFSNGIVKNMGNPDIRWIYKVYKKPGKDFKRLLQLKNYLNEITEDKKVKLLCHYLKAYKALSNSKCDLHFDRDSLKIYKNTKDNEYVGVIEPILTGNIQIKDILIIFDVLDDGKGTLTSLRRKVSEAKNANSVLGELIKTLTELIHHKEKYEDKKKELIIDFPNRNTQLNGTQKPTSSVKDTTSVSQLQNQQEKKVEAESIDSKQPVQKTLRKLSGTVKWFNDKKGFGFIAQDNGDDVFVHQTSIQGEGFRTLAEGDKVEFEITKDEKGNNAANVVKV